MKECAIIQVQLFQRCGGKHCMGNQHGFQADFKRKVRPIRRGTDTHGLR